MGDQNIVVRLSANVAAFQAQMGAAAAAVRQAGSDAVAAAASAEAATKKVAAAMTAMGAAAVVGAGLAVKAASDFESRMRNVATVSDDVASRFGAAGQEILDLSTTLPQSANVLAEGLYDIASSGFDGAAAMEVLEKSAAAASAGLTDTATSARAITAVINAYGLSAAQAGDISDTLFQVVNKGVITFEQLAQNMGDVVPSAAAAGVALDEAGAALAAITLAGVPAAEATTSLGAMLRYLINPSEDLAAVYAQLGYASGQAALDALGLQGVMFELQKVTGGSAEGWQKLFPEIRAARGAMASMANDGANYIEVAGDIIDVNSRAGATAEALAHQSEGLGYQMSILRNGIAAVAIEFGTALLPVIKPIVAMIQALVTGFSELPGPVQTAVGVIGLLVGAVLALGGGFVLLAPRIAAAGTVMTTVAAQATVAGAAVRGFQAALGPVGLAMAAATVAIGLFGKAHSDNKRHVNEFTEALKLEGQAADDAVKAIIDHRIVSEDLDKAAAEAGVSIDLVSRAMNREEGAAAELDKQLREVANAGTELIDRGGGTEAIMTDQAKAARELASSVFDVADELGTAREEHERLGAVQKATGGAMEDTTGKVKSQADAMTDLAEAIASVFDPQAAYEDALAAQAEAVDAHHDHLRRQLEMTHDAEREALNDRIRMERDAFQASRDAQREALAARHAAEVEALADVHDANVESLADIHAAHMEALQARFQAEADQLDAQIRERRNALEDQVRDEKQALDDSIRLQRRAMDERLALIDREHDKRKKEAKKGYEAEKAELEWLIRTTWGAEREGAIERLDVLEAAHDERLAELDQQKDAEVQAEKDKQSDSEREQKNALDDRHRTLKQALDDETATWKRALRDQQDALVAAEKDRYDTQVAAEKARYDAQVAAATARHDAEKAALAAETKALGDELDERHRRVVDNLEDRQQAENDAADARRAAAKTKQDLSLGQLQDFLDDQADKYEAFNRNLAIIASRGGADVMGIVAQLGPEVVEKFAKAGPAAFDAFLESLRAQIAAKGMSETTADLISKGLIPLPPGVHGPPAPARVYARAEGHVAQIARAGDWRVWAEPETGGESYIPWALSKRPRSTAILAQTAHAFGYGLMPMADGGMIGREMARRMDQARTSVMNHVEVQVRVAAGVDPDAVGHAVRREVERAMDNLSRQVTVRAWRN